MLKIILRAYSSLIFLDSVYAGAILVAVSFLNYSVAISGIVAIVAAMGFAHFIHVREEFLFRGFYVYNSLLVGMGIGYLFTPTVLSLMLVAILSIFTFMLSFMLNRLMSVYGIPILSLPFSIVTIFSYLAVDKYSMLFSSSMDKGAVFDIHLPLLLSALFKSYGTIFFLPNNIAGIVIFFILLFHSRMIFMVSIIGFYVGVFAHSIFIGSLDAALTDVYAFNYIITAIALCGVFLLPTIQNFLIAMSAVLVTVIMADAMSVFFSYYAITVFTIPFNLTVSVFIFMLYLIGYKGYNYRPFHTPEESFSNYLSSIYRFGSNKIKIALPFSGIWNVYQAFNGKWTHKGAWRYAYDFVIQKDGKTYTNEGHYVSDYYCFGEAVLSPVTGYVVACRHDLEDNPIGKVDKVNNWGNYIIIRSDSGVNVEISHLMQLSLLVDIGYRVTVGQVIAKCGNSGYSPQPHIHIQVQKFSTLGSETIPFYFTEYVKEDKVVFNNVPALGTDVKNLVVNKHFAEKLSFSLDEEYRYDIIKNGVVSGEFSIKVKMNDFGEFYFEDKEFNKLYFYPAFEQFYFYKYFGSQKSYLNNLYTILPKVPLIQANVTYVDYIAPELISSTMQKVVLQFLASFYPDIYMKKVEYKLDEKSVSSEFGSVVFDTYKKGFVEIYLKDILLKRKEEE